MQYMEKKSVTTLMYFLYRNSLFPSWLMSSYWKLARFHNFSDSYTSYYSLILVFNPYSYFFKQITIKILSLFFFLFCHQISFSETKKLKWFYYKESSQHVKNFLRKSFIIVSPYIMKNVFIIKDYQIMNYCSSQNQTSIPEVFFFFFNC